jgi:ribonuclease T2
VIAGALRVQLRGCLALTIRVALFSVFLGAAGASARSPEPEGTAGHFDYYVLALSWSPAFCATHDDAAQCGLRRGFVAHGLWPQYFDGGGPEHCESQGRPDEQTIDRALSAMPDPRLVRHEWDAHGTCTGLSPHDYFVDLIRAVAMLSIPADFDGSRAHRMTADDITSEFVRANPTLSRRSLAVRCRGDQFEELRICLSSDLHAVPCGHGVHTHCRQGPVFVQPAQPSR